MSALSSWLLAFGLGQLFAVSISFVNLRALGSSRFLRPPIERRRYYLCFHALSTDFHFYRSADRSLRGRNAGQRNILLQERRRRTAGHVADLASALVQNSVSVSGNASVDHFQTYQRLLHAFSFRLFERRAAYKIRLLHLAETIQTRFPHVDRVRDFVPVERQLSFEAERVARAQAAGDDAKFFPKYIDLVN